MANRTGPNRPKPKAISLASDETAIVVLDLSARCQDPKEVCWKLMKPLAKFLERARARRVSIIYTVSAHTRGTPMQEVAAPLKRRDTEPVGEDMGHHAALVAGQQRRPESRLQLRQRRHGWLRAP